MANHKIEDLRNHLFATLEALRSKDNPMEIERAKAIADVAKVIVDTAKVEVAFIEATGIGETGFLPKAPVNRGRGELPEPRAAGTVRTQ